MHVGSLVNAAQFANVQDFLANVILLYSIMYNAAMNI